MSETLAEVGDADLDELSSYTSETPASKVAVTDRAVASGPAGAIGRRKEAIARVRITPGTGKFTVNGRTLEAYFPNKCAPARPPARATTCRAGTSPACSSGPSPTPVRMS